MSSHLRSPCFSYHIQKKIQDFKDPLFSLHEWSPNKINVHWLTKTNINTKYQSIWHRHNNWTSTKNFISSNHSTHTVIISTFVLFPCFSFRKKTLNEFGACFIAALINSLMPWQRGNFWNPETSPAQKQHLPGRSFPKGIYIVFKKASGISGDN